MIVNLCDEAGGGNSGMVKHIDRSNATRDKRHSEEKLGCWTTVSYTLAALASGARLEVVWLPPERCRQPPFRDTPDQLDLEVDYKGFGIDAGIQLASQVA